MGLYDNPPYYLTAYGLAVKHGFTGTEREWLDSLVGPQGPQGNGLVFLGTYEDEAHLRAAHPTGEPGDCYKVGTETEYLAYYWDPEAKGGDGDWASLQLQGPKGDKGEQGDTGPIGPRGERGETGPAGHTGARGPEGPTGSQGPMGPQGQQGVAGPTGPAGPQGARGEKGDAFTYDDFTPEQLEALKGPQGDQGPRGLQGQEGPQGPKGDPGSGFKVLGYYSSKDALERSVLEPQDGDAYGVGSEEPYDIYIYGQTETEPGWTNYGPLQGAKGDPGEDGARGPAGEAATITIRETTTLPAGSKATVRNDGDEQNAEFSFGIPQGPKGDAGTPGAAGKDGDTWVPSVDDDGNLTWEKNGEGTPEEKNIKGPKGDAGAQGPTGAQGLQGDPGPRGDPGPKAVPIDITATSNGWEGNEQTLEDEKFLEGDYIYLVGLARSAAQTYKGGPIWADDVTEAGKLVLHCRREPGTDLALHIIRLEAEAT